MKRSTIAIIILFLSFVSAFAQVNQSGRVLEYNGKEQKTPLKRVVQIAVDGASSTVSDMNTGAFTLDFKTKKKGDRIVFAPNPRATGYELMNTRELESWNINPNKSLNVVFCNKTRFDELCAKYYNISLKSYETKLAQDKQKLSDALKANKLQQKEYEQKLAELETSYQTSLANIDKYVDQFARIDLSEVGAKEQAILALVDEGKIDEAIAEYDKLDATSKIIEANRNIKSLENAKDKIETEIDNQKAAKDSLLAVFYREIDLLKMAGGKENYDKAGQKWKELADADTTNLKVVEGCAYFLYNQKDFNAAIKYFDICYRLSGEDIILKSSFLNCLGNLYISLYDFQKSEELLLQNLENYKLLYEKNPEANGANLAACLNNLGNLYYYLQDYKKSEEYFSQSLEIKKELFKNDLAAHRGELAVAQNNLGLLYYTLHEYKKSEECYLQALENYKALYELDPDANREDLAMTQNNLGLLYYYLPDYQKSEEYYLQALENRKILFDKNPDAYRYYYSTTQMNLALLYNDLHDYQKSKDFYLQALENKKALFDSNPDAYRSSLADIQNNFGMLCSDLHDYQKCEELYLQALDNYNVLHKSNPNAYTDNLAMTLYNLGALYNDLHDYGKSEEYYLQSLENTKVIYEKFPAAYLALYSLTYNSLSLVYAHQQKYDKAMESIDSALSLSPEDPNLYDSKGEILLMQNKDTEALEMYRKVLELSPKYFEENDSNFYKKLKEKGLIQ